MERLPHRYCTMRNLLLNKQQRIWGGVYIHALTFFEQYTDMVVLPSAFVQSK